MTRAHERARRRLVGYAHDYPDGWRTGWHAHPRVQLLAAVRGVMRVATDTALLVVPPGTGLWLPAGIGHEVVMDGPVSMRALFVREDAARAGPAATSVLAVSPLLREIIVAACAEGVDWDPAGRGPHLAALAMLEIRRAAALPLGLPAARDPRLVRVTEALHADPADPRDLDAFAAIAGASARTLTRLFRAETGMGFDQWRRQLRLIEARALLAAGVAPARAAAATGYASAPAFGAAFRAAFGITPGAARQP